MNENIQEIVTTIKMSKENSPHEKQNLLYGIDVLLVTRSPCSCGFNDFEPYIYQE